MAFLVRRLILLWYITSLSACVIVNDFKDDLKTFESKPEVKLPYQHCSADFQVAWDILQNGDDTVIDGFIKNVTNRQVLEIDLLVEVFDIDGRKLSSAAVFLPNINLQKNKSSAFSVKLNNAIIAEGNILSFINYYRFNSGAWGGSSLDSRFMVDATTGSTIEEQRRLRVTRGGQ